MGPRLAGVAGLLCACALLPAPASAARESSSGFYVSLGDSYASGYQPSVVGSGRNTTNGFAYQVPALAAARGYALSLVNFGCGGATTTSLLRAKGCRPRALGPRGTAYPGRTQIAAATRFLRANREDVELVTVSIGGNDVTACARAAEPIPCVAAATDSIRRNVTSSVRQLRAAAGPDVRIVGTTYPDVILGEYVTGEGGRQLAALSVAAFRSLINPALKKAYEDNGGTFVDVTRAAGSYTPLSQTTTFQPYGRIPIAVAKVCELSYYCALGDIHLRTDGYRLIADLVVRKLPRRG